MTFQRCECDEVAVPLRLLTIPGFSLFSLVDPKRVTYYEEVADGPDH